MVLTAAALMPSGAVVASTESRIALPPEAAATSPELSRGRVLLPRAVKLVINYRQVATA
ncbi:MAG: hypothetical protein AAGI30_10760 [Planctomycetota bacterium]